jgi:hypothetical protein
MNETMTAEMYTALNSLRRLPPRARLRVIALALPEVAHDLDTGEPSPSPDKLDAEAQAAAEDQFKQELLAMGVLTEIKDPMLYPTQDDRTPPATVEGTPLSEMIIAERR